MLLMQKGNGRVWGANERRREVYLRKMPMGKVEAMCVCMCGDETERRFSIATEVISIQTAEQTDNSRVVMATKRRINDQPTLGDRTGCTGTVARKRIGFTKKVRRRWQAENAQYSCCW